MGYVRAYKPGDEIYIAHCLRQADRQELQALSDRPAVDTLLDGGVNSQPSCTVVGNSGLGAGMFGAINEGAGSGRIWLLGTDELITPPLCRQFLRESKAYVRGMERRYKVLHNHVMEANELHVRWLKWCGFTFIRRVNRGRSGEPFLDFIKVCRSE